MTGAPLPSFGYGVGAHATDGERYIRIEARYYDYDRGTDIYQYRIVNESDDRRHTAPADWLEEETEPCTVAEVCEYV